MNSTFNTDVMKDFSGSLNDYVKELGRRLKTVIKRKWFVGVNDRGMGRVDFAVLAKFKGQRIVIIECSCREIANHICLWHNKSVGATQ